MYWDEFWASYFSDVVETGRASALCGLPARTRTDVSEDLATGDIVIRYE